MDFDFSRVNGAEFGCAVFAGDTARNGTLDYITLVHTVFLYVFCGLVYVSVSGKDSARTGADKDFMFGFVCRPRALLREIRRARRRVQRYNTNAAAVYDDGGIRIQFRENTL